MGGLTGGRYIGPRGTTGDLTGGGRPIEAVQAAPTGRGLPYETQGISSGQLQEQFPQASVQQMRASQRGQGRMGLSAEDRARHKQMVRRNQVLEARGLPYHQDYSPYIPHMAPPPRGGYSGGVIPRFQAGSKIRGKGAAARARGMGPAAIRRRQRQALPWTWVPEEGLWGLPHTDPRYFYELQPPGKRGAPAGTGGGGGGYSGGVIPRFQEGGEVAAPYPVGGDTPAGPAPSLSEWLASRGMSEFEQDLMPPWGGDHVQFQWAAQQEAMRKAAAAAARAQAATARKGTQARRQASRSPGGWQEGGSVGINTFIPQPDLLQDLSQRNSYQPLFAGRRNKVLAARGLPPYRPVIQEMNPYAPPRGGGGRGWQVGGQLEDPLFPVESELADESPWYPDEDVGYEEAVPMQGGFDIFGRSGG